MNNIIRKFNIIDILIVSVLVLGILALFYKLVTGSTDKTEVFEFTYICDESPITLLDGIQENENCVDADLGTELGTLLSVKTDILDENNTLGSAVIVTKTEGEASEHGIEVENSIYLKGKKINLIIGNSVFEVYLSDIKNVSEG